MEVKMFENVFKQRENEKTRKYKLDIENKRFIEVYRPFKLQIKIK